ncbi:MAG TPA: trypsin-like peptidase domain-containing protein, partial [Candidatus Acidoferrales bacterium]|nr:trypsin-like peptidase domain-containing protein [Candidatus Acidoferrales bacterium]
MTQQVKVGRAIRWIAIGLVIGLGAYWAGSRYGPRTAVSVSAVRPVLTPVSAIPPLDSANVGPLDSTEAQNVRIYKQAAPSVANILTRTVEYDFFFNPVPVEGAGSGFLIDNDGHILTNYHVVQGTQTIQVTFGDRSTYKARFIGADTANDIALIQIDTKGRKLVPLPLGDSRKLQVGQRVLAIGNPFGFQSTLTTGIVSALGRTVQTSDNTFIDDAIQTDAAINRGNSGGPLLDSRGEVIGINSAIYSPSGTTAGIGFAIPISTARRVAQDLIEHGRVLRATLGVEGRTLGPDLADALGLSVGQGVLVESVSSGGPAAKAGIHGGNRVVLAGLRELKIGGDVIIGINGKEVNSQSD